MPDSIIARDLSWIKCLRCGKTSCNQNDVMNGYCGFCREFRTDATVETGTPECDFCSTDPPVWQYPARSFDTGETYGRLRPESTGAWLACDECAALIEKRDHYALLERAMRCFLKTHQGRALPPESRSEVSRLHASFFKARAGAVERLRLPGVK